MTSELASDTSPAAPPAGERATDAGFHIRAASFLPVRIAYVNQVLLGDVGLDPNGKQALVVGSGRGLLARELARLEMAVTAVDSSPAATQLAQEADTQQGVLVHHQAADPQQLPYPDETFEVAYYHDTFETTDDLDQVLAEAARVLRPGGTLLYDTVTRTRLSRLIYLGALQSWRFTRVLPPNTYTWERLRPPHDLAGDLAEHGLHNQSVTGFLPASPPRLVRAMLRARRGTISDDELAELAGMHQAPPEKAPDVTYLGYAVNT